MDPQGLLQESGKYSPGRRVSCETENVENETVPHKAAGKYIGQLHPSLQGAVQSSSLTQDSCGISLCSVRIQTDSFASLKAKVLGKGKGDDVLILLFNKKREIQACERMHKKDNRGLSRKRHEAPPRDLSKPALPWLLH